MVQPNCLAFKERVSLRNTLLYYSLKRKPNLPFIIRFYFKQKVFLDQYQYQSLQINEHCVIKIQCIFAQTINRNKNVYDWDHMNH